MCRAKGGLACGRPQGAMCQSQPKTHNCDPVQCLNTLESGIVCHWACFRQTLSVLCIMLTLCFNDLA